jgi:hypothetical protein
LAEFIFLLFNGRLTRYLVTGLDYYASMKPFQARSASSFCRQVAAGVKDTSFNSYEEKKITQMFITATTEATKE